MLVVDDDAAIRKLVVGLLVEAGYDAQTALDGDHARRSSIALHPDLIILDVQVPEKAMALRFAEAYRDRVPAEIRAPIIALSRDGDLEEVGRQLGASAFLSKPLDVDELIRLVAKFLPETVAAVDPVATTEPAPDAAEATPNPLSEPAAGTA